jgi:hypothetical protein
MYSSVISLQRANTNALVLAYLKLSWRGKTKEMAVKKMLKKIDLRLYAALLVLGLCPTIYTTVRTHFLGQLPGDWSFSIAGQLTWVNLLYEVLEEAIILPLFFILGTPSEDRKEFSNRVKTGAAASVLIY